MGRPTRDRSLFHKLEADIRAILDSPDAKVSDRIQAVNAMIKLIDLKRGIDEDKSDNFFGKSKD